ncbi:hypothetical protein pEaSNUABM14_00219 [Erwinia phage pEa_SNUABM_14]|nr:hypothetical protein pEaSNUABM14_00219 [Erwinia phage pEa_SNUABM_14]
MAKPVYGKKAVPPGWAGAVPKSFHKYFWDMIYQCPKPKGAKSDKFYESLAWFFIHLIDKSRMMEKRNVYNETVVTYSYMRAHEKMRYAMVRQKNDGVRLWLDRKVNKTRFDYIKGIARKYSLNTVLAQTLADLCALEEPMYNLLKPNRRRAIFQSQDDLVAAAFEKEVKAKPFRRPHNFIYHKSKNREVIELINRAQANQRPYRFYLDRFLDIKENARTNRRYGLHMRLDSFLKKICRFGLRLVNDNPNDRLVEFYDEYSMNHVGSRLFGTAAALPKIVKLLCFDHSYGRNFDMPNAQIVLLLDLMSEYGLECPMLEHLDHDYVAKTLKITRGTSKTLNYGGIYSGWSNQRYFKQTFDTSSEKEDPGAMMTDIFRQLVSDTKVQNVGKKYKMTEEEIKNYATRIWGKWKAMFEPASLVVEELCLRIKNASYSRTTDHFFKNASGCSHRVPVARYKRDQYTILSHLIQGMENYNLLKVLAEAEWCSAEFDGAILLTKYSGDVALKEKPFMDPTLNCLIFMKLWDNGYSMGKVKRNLFTKRGFATDPETVNREYLKIAAKLQRERNDQESSYQTEEGD